MNNTTGPLGGPTGGGVDQTDLTNGGAGGGGGGYTGLQGVLDFLGGSGGINATQYQNMMNGYGGYKVGGQMYKVPGSKGALSGLSPWAIQYLMKNIMKQDTPQQTSLTGLTGDALFQATLMNAAHNAAPALYHLNTAMTDGGLKDENGASETAEQYLNALFQGGALGSNKTYRNKNYGEDGYTAPAGGNQHTGGGGLDGHPNATTAHPHYRAYIKAGGTMTMAAWNHHGRPKQ
jgi:hypothetical protein